jgi:two-component system, OmpR family, response regulator
MTSSALPPPASKSKIIVGVDDTAESLTLLGHAVNDAGYTFVGAASGQEGLGLLARIEPRFILLDIQMPDMDGFETCRRIRADSRLTQVPVAFLTARKTTADVRAGMAAGGNDFIAKPFDPAKLCERIHYWVARRVNKGW